MRDGYIGEEKIKCKGWRGKCDIQHFQKENCFFSGESCFQPLGKLFSTIDKTK